MKDIWFKAKTYGWGWTPCTWQGWLITFLWIVLAILTFKVIDINSHSGSDTLIVFSIPFVILVTLLITICYLKGEKPRWRWGN